MYVKLLYELHAHPRTVVDICPLTILMRLIKLQVTQPSDNAATTH